MKMAASPCWIVFSFTPAWLLGRLSPGTLGEDTEDTEGGVLVLADGGEAGAALE